MACVASMIKFALWLHCICQLRHKKSQNDALCAKSCLQILKHKLATNDCKCPSYAHQYVIWGGF